MKFGVSVEEYLDGEKRSSVRHEYIGGAVYAMAGASANHIALTMNFDFALRQALRGGPCRVQMSEAKIRLLVSDEDIFYYPGVMVVCDPRDTTDYYKRFPKTVIVEVLSESTEAIDRREKFLSYRQIEALEEYVLVSQAKMEITIFRRAKKWPADVVAGNDARVELRSIGFTAPMSALYEGVKV